jgi:hypothetical protein
MTTYHVRHDFTPSTAREVLILMAGTEASTETALIEHARARDLDIGRRQSIAKVLSSLGDIGLIERSIIRRGDLSLTTLGRKLATIARRDELLFAEMIHQLYWWLWTPEETGPRFAWAYQTIATVLWNDAPTTIENDRLVSHVMLLAEQQFSDAGISFSSSSVLGILHWLRALSPPCIQSNNFSRRVSCTPEALLVTIEGICAARAHPLGIPLRLDTPTRKWICQANLIELDSLDEVLVQAEETLGLVYRTGSQGESVLLHEAFLPELIRGTKAQWAN